MSSLNIEVKYNINDSFSGEMLDFARRFFFKFLDEDTLKQIREGFNNAT